MNILSKIPTEQLEESVIKLPQDKQERAVKLLCSRFLHTMEQHNKHRTIQLTEEHISLLITRELCKQDTFMFKQAIDAICKLPTEVRLGLKEVCDCMVFAHKMEFLMGIKPPA